MLAVRMIAVFMAVTLSIATATQPAVAGPEDTDTVNPMLPAPESDDLTRRAQHLFDAIAQGRPELADDFFFPREPFLALKDVKDPARYYNQLLSAYHHDLRDLHGKRRGWEGATFRSFELGTPPRRVKPGKEWNKIGYHRTYRATLRYQVSGKVRKLEVHTIISWDGKWYVTHLLPIRRAARSSK